MADDGRPRAGLDVDVLDSWSNQVREVNLLSGGEKFLASLSLALGLADVVQGDRSLIEKTSARLPRQGAEDAVEVESL